MPNKIVATWQLRPMSLSALTGLPCALALSMQVFLLVCWHTLSATQKMVVVRIIQLPTQKREATGSFKSFGPGAAPISIFSKDPIGNGVGFGPVLF